jgi:hypothetical protein
VVGRPEARDRCPTLEKLGLMYRTPGYIWVGQLVEAVVGLSCGGGGEAGGGSAKVTKGNHVSYEALRRLHSGVCVRFVRNRNLH